MNTQQQDQHWNAWAAPIQQLNPDGPGRTLSNLIESWKFLGRNLHNVWGVQLKRAAKLLTPDCVNHQA